MTIRKTDACENETLDTGFDAVFNSGILEMRTGTQPAAASAAATGTVVWTKTLSADVFAAASAGVKGLVAALQAVGVAAGNAGWFRLKKAADTDAVTEAEARVDGSVTATGGGGDLTLDNVSIAVDQSVTVNSLAVTV